MLTRRNQFQPTTHLEFDGLANSYVDLGVTNILPDATATCTISAWIYLKPFSTGSTDYIGVIIGNRRDANTAGWTFKVSNLAQQKLEFVFFDQGAASQGWISNVTVPSNRWCHVGVTFDGTQVIFYIDGNPDPKEKLTVSKTITEYTGQNVRIGHRQAAGSTFETFSGAMSDVCVWNRVLTTSEFVTMYNNRTVSATNLLHRYPMLDGSGSTVTDSVGGSNGTIVGGVTWSTSLLNTQRRTGGSRATAGTRGTATNVQNKVLSLNGTSDFATVANLTPPIAQFSVSFWVKFKTAFVTSARVIDQQDAGPTNGFAFLVTSTPALQLSIKNSGTTDASPSSGTLSLNTWYHVVGAFKTNSLKFYVDNVLVGTDTSCAMTAPAGLFTIGRRTSGSTNFCEMEIADIRMFNHQLSENEVYYLYERNYAEGAGQLAYLPFNNDANNKTGAASNATLTGGSYVIDGVFYTRRKV